MLSVGSLFSGIGGFDLGLERTGGFRTAWFCEQDEFCQRVLAKHWPGVPCHTDVRAIHAGHPDDIRCPDCVPDIDVLCGGFPCQDLSVAGKGAGLAGARSGLWSEYARLIGELRPRYVVVENVSALLARGLGTVLGDLAALGYDTEWDCIPASAVGAPHQRDRVWLVAYPSRDLQARPAAAWTERERARPGNEPGAPHPDTNSWRREVGAQRDRGPQRPELEAQQQRDADGLRDDVADSASARLEGPRPNGSQGTGRRQPAHPRLAVGDSAGSGRDAPSPQGPSEHQGRESQGPTGRPSRHGSGEGWWLAEPDVGRVAHGVPQRVDRLRSLGNALVPQIAEWIGHRILAYEHGANADAA